MQAKLDTAHAQVSSLQSDIRRLQLEKMQEQQNFQGEISRVRNETAATISAYQKELKKLKEPQRNLIEKVAENGTPAAKTLMTLKAELLETQANLNRERVLELM